MQHLKSLSINKYLVIIRPNKRNGVVLLNRSDYVSKVETILNDVSKFVKLECDPLELCQKRENRLIRFLRDTLLSEKAIPQEIYRELFTSGSTPGILYGLPKVYKSDCPARPILFAIGT